MSMTGESRRGTMIPITVAFAVALAGTAAMFLIEFSNDFPPNGISMITAARADRAGATAHPTAGNVDLVKAVAR
jgi:hypothetical protein